MRKIGNALGTTFKIVATAEKTAENIAHDRKANKRLCPTHPLTNVIVLRALRGVWCSENGSKLPHPIHSDSSPPFLILVIIMAAE